MKKGFKSTLKDGRDIYVPLWSAEVSLENLSWAGKILGDNALMAISENNINAVKLTLMNPKSTPAEALELVKNFACSARIDGTKVTEDNMHGIFNGLGEFADCFAIVCHAQFHDFFNYGLAEEDSQ